MDSIRPVQLRPRERCKQARKLLFVRFSGTCYTTSYEKKS